MPHRRGTTLIGLLVALVCILVLSVVSLNALNKAMTGAGATLPGSAASFEDQQYLVALFQSIATHAHLNEGRFIVPSEVAGGRDVSLNTTADLFSAMIAQHYTVPGQLISANEHNPFVHRDDDYDYDYDYTAYDPSAGVHWDPGFVADLDVDSNDSFAHVPLYGERLRQQWRFNTGGRTVLLGTRGPRDGVPDPASYTYGRTGLWAGHLVFGDGHIEYTDTFTPAGLVFVRDGAQQPDNIYAMEEGPEGGDAILAFTKSMSDDGPDLQFD